MENFYVSKTKVSLCPGKAYVLVLNGLVPGNASAGTLYAAEGFEYEYRQKSELSAGCDT